MVALGLDDERERVRSELDRGVARWAGGESLGWRGGRALKLLGELRGYIGDALQCGGLHLHRDIGEFAEEGCGIVAR